MDKTLKAKETTERRRFTRYRVNLQAAHGLQIDQLLDCTVVDISHGGMRVISSKYFAPNTVLLGEIAIPERKDDHGRIRYSGVAKHSRLLPSGMHMGVEYCVLAPSSKKAIRNYLERFQEIHS